MPPSIYEDMNNKNHLSPRLLSECTDEHFRVTPKQSKLTKKMVSPIQSKRNEKQYFSKCELPLQITENHVKYRNEPLS